MIGEAVSVIKRARTEQRMTIHVLVEFDPHTQVVLVGDRAARAESEVRAIRDLGGRKGQTLLKIDTYLIGVHAGVDEEFGPVFVPVAGLRFFVRGIVIAGVFIASV